jgi:predicted dehydrogenase
VDDISLLQFAFADGSLATIQYFSNGNKSFPKERVEMFFDGKSMRLDNFRTVSSWGISGATSRWPRRQDKGHLNLVRAFLGAVKAGGPAPIPMDQILEVSRFSIDAGRLASEGGGSVTAAEMDSRRVPR